MYMRVYIYIIHTYIHTYVYIYIYTYVSHMYIYIYIYICKVDVLYVLGYGVQCYFAQSSGPLIDVIDC